MRRIAFLIIFIPFVAFSQSSYDTRIAEAMNASDWFALDSIYKETPKDSISEFLEIFSRCMIGNRFNRPDVSIPAFTKLLHTQSTNLDMGNLMSSAIMYAMDLSRFGANAEAARMLTAVIDAVKPHVNESALRSVTNKPCALQLIEEYERYNSLIVGLYPVPLTDVSHFGIMTGVWEDKDERILNVSTIHEKPTANYAEEYLSVRNSLGKREYCSVFGQYILTPEVFEQLEADIKQADAEGNKTREIELTSALETVRSRVGMMGVRLYSQRFDMGNPKALVDTIAQFSHL